MAQNKKVTLQVGVKILIRNRQGKYLLLHRSIKKYPDIDGRWDIPGGRIEAGTPLLANLAREVKEETGLTLGKQLQLIAAQDILRTKGRHVVRLTYIGQGVGKVILDPEEHDDYTWFNVKELTKKNNVDVYLRELVRSGLVNKKK